MDHAYQKQILDSYNRHLEQEPEEVRLRACDLHSYQDTKSGRWYFLGKHGELLNPEPVYPALPKPARKPAPVPDTKMAAWMGKAVGKSLAPIRKSMTQMAEKLADTIDAHNTCVKKIECLERKLDEMEAHQAKGAENMRYKGTWQSGIDYQPGDVVSHENLLWHCGASGEKGVRPRRADNWQKLFNPRQHQREEQPND